MSKKRALFVHPDPEVLLRLREMLDPEIECDLLRSSSEAADALSDHGFDLVAVGARMADASGAELLSEAASRHALAVRILITDPQDPDSTIGTAGPAHQFLAKTCDDAELREALRSALRVGDLLDEPGLRALTSRIRALPSLPSLYLQILRELRSPDPSIARIARTICDDVGMAAKTLQLVNTVAYAPRVRIHDPMRAAIYLGVDTLKALVLSAKVFAQFERIDLAELTVGELWDHSTYVASLARRIAIEQSGKEVGDAAFLAGVVHDIGKLVLAANLSEDYLEATALARQHGIALFEAERIVFGATHAQIGGYLMALWGVPHDVVRATRFHHRPSEEPSGGEGRVDALLAVHVANGLDHERRGDTGGRSPFDAAWLEERAVTGRLDAWRHLL